MNVHRTERHADIQTDKYRQTKSHEDRNYLDRQTETHTYKETVRQTNKEPNGQKSGRQIDIQTDK